MRVIFPGGGTMGSFMPLFVIDQALKNETDYQSLFITSHQGPENSFVVKHNLNQTKLPTVKLIRYFCLSNLSLPLRLFLVFVKAIFIVKKFKPQLVVSCGSYLAVPVIYAAKLFGAKIVLYQMDIQPTLSNKLCSWLADRIFLAFDKSLEDYPQSKSEVIGAIVNKSVTTSDDSELKSDVLIIGGGTGAVGLNRLVLNSLADLSNFKIIHLTGINKGNNLLSPNYKSLEFVDNVYDLMANSKMVICRAGMSTLFEAAQLAKPTIIVPLPNSHQEYNSGYFAQRGAAIEIKENNLNAKIFALHIKSLLADSAKQSQLSSAIHNLLKFNGLEIMVKYIKSYGDKF